MKNIFNIIIFCILLPTLLSAQHRSGAHTDYGTGQMQPEWVRHFASDSLPNDDWVNAISTDSDGNIYVTGNSFLTFSGNDIVTIKYDSNGTEQWNVSYNGPQNSSDIPKSIIVDNSRNVFVAGYSKIEGIGRNFTTIKYSPSGEILWISEFLSPSTNSNSFGSVVADDSGNVYVTGSGDQESITAKYDLEGTELWKKTLIKSLPNAVTLSDSGYLYVTGKYTDSNYDYFVVKYNSDGTEMWNSNWNGTGDSKGAIDIAVDESGNVYITGTTNSLYTTVKYNANGMENWAVYYDGVGNSDKANSIAIDSFGNIYVTGNTGTVKYNSKGTELWINDPSGSNITADKNGFIYLTNWNNISKYDTSAALIWTKSYAGRTVKKLVIDAMNNISVIGEDRLPTNGYDFVTESFNSKGDKRWTGRYNGPGISRDTFADMAIDDDGNIYVSGKSGDDFTTVKFDPNGNQDWTVFYLGPTTSFNSVEAVATDNSGNIIITGRTWFSGRRFYDYTTVKYNPGGLEEWVVTYDGPADSSFDYANAIVVNDSGEVYITGESYDIHTISSKITTIKYNTDGERLWTARYPGGSAEHIALDDSGNVYVAGSTIIKYNPDGVRRWAKTIRRTAGIALDNSGNIYHTSKDSTTKFDLNGNWQWSVNTDGMAIEVDNFGNIFIARRTAFPDYDYSIIKINSDGTTLWSVRYDSPDNRYDTPKSLAIDDEGSVYLTGYSSVQSYSISDAYITTVKYNGDGELQWEAFYDTPGTALDLGKKIIVDPNGFVYVAGTTAVQWGYWSVYTIIKYEASPVSVEDEIGSTQSSFQLSQNYPNPFNPITTIEYTLPKDSNVSLTVYNLRGQEVTRLLNETQKAGFHSISWDASGLSSGIYLYKIRAGEFTEIKKMVLLK